jgi:hypothetical protein
MYRTFAWCPPPWKEADPCNPALPYQTPVAPPAAAVNGAGKASKQRSATEAAARQYCLHKQKGAQGQQPRRNLRLCIGPVGCDCTQGLLTLHTVLCAAGAAHRAANSWCTLTAQVLQKHMHRVLDVANSGKLPTLWCLETAPVANNPPCVTLM